MAFSSRTASLYGNQQIAAPTGTEGTGGGGTVLGTRSKSTGAITAPSDPNTVTVGNVISGGTGGGSADYLQAAQRQMANGRAPAPIGGNNSRPVVLPTNPARPVLTPTMGSAAGSRPVALPSRAAASPQAAQAIQSKAMNRNRPPAAPGVASRISPGTVPRSRRSF